MAHTVEEMILKAKTMIVDGNYYYIYGMKGQMITKQIIMSLATQYPSIYNNDILKMSLEKVQKGYGIDCSGFVCKAAGISNIGSYQIYTISRNKWSIQDLSYIKNGMFIWRNGHIGLIEIDEYGDKWILEAKGTAYDLCRTKFEERYRAFTHYGEIKGVNYPVVKKTNYIFKLQSALYKMGYKDSKGEVLKLDGKVGWRTYSACPTLHYGSHNAVVGVLQEWLKSLGYYKGAIDSDWGMVMNKAVYDYQVNEVKLKYPDKEFTRMGKSWAKILGIN